MNVPVDVQLARRLGSLRGGRDVDSVDVQGIDGGEEAEDGTQLGPLEVLEGVKEGRGINRLVVGLEKGHEDQPPEVSDGLVRGRQDKGGSVNRGSSVSQTGY